MSKWRKNQYELIAGVFKYAKQIEIDMLNDKSPNASPQALAAIQVVEMYMANKLQADNPLFDRNKFLKACGLESETDNG